MSDDLQPKKKSKAKTIAIIIIAVVAILVIIPMAVAGFQGSLMGMQQKQASNPLPIKNWMANDNQTNNSLDSTGYMLLNQCDGNEPDSVQHTCVTAIKTMQTKCAYGELRACENADFQALLRSDMKAHNLT